eukprot:6204442-Pleurochrysis_carterae.AAC.1
MVATSPAVVTQGNRESVAQMTAELLHAQFNNRCPDVLRLLPKCTRDALDSSATLARNFACEECLTTNSDAVHSTAHMPATKAAGDIVSYDTYYMSTPHVHGGQKYVINFHDHYSTFNMLYLLAQNKADAHRQRGGPDLETKQRLPPSDRHVPHHDLTARTSAEWSMRKGNGVRWLETCARNSQPLSCQYPWWYRLKSSTDVSALLPSRATPNKSPWFRFTGQIPFCAGVFQTNRLPRASKDHATAAQTITLIHAVCVYPGRARDQPGHMCLDPVTKRIYVSPHARFVEFKRSSQASEHQRRRRRTTRPTQREPCRRHSRWMKTTPIYTTTQSR